MFWVSIILYTIGYLYFFFVSLESSAWQLSYKSVLGRLSPYFYSDWMFAPAIVCGIIFLTGCMMLTKIIYGRFKRSVALLPSGGIFLLIFFYIFSAVFAMNSEAKYIYVIFPIALLVYLVLTWLFCLQEYKNIQKSSETD